MMDVDEALRMAATWTEVPDYRAVHVLAAEVRRLRSERDAVLNMLEGRDVELARRLRAQIAFERGEA